MHKQLSTSDELHDEENLKVSLEDILHTNEERMISFLQDIFLEHSRLNLIVVQNDVLSEGFHGIDRARVFLLDKEHFSKTSLTNNFDDLEGIKTCRHFILLQTPLENGS